MLDILWQVFLGSLIVLAIVLVWTVIAACAFAGVRHFYSNEYKQMRQRHEKQRTRVEEALKDAHKP